MACLGGEIDAAGLLEWKKEALNHLVRLMEKPNGVVTIPKVGFVDAYDNDGKLCVFTPMTVPG